MSVINLRRFDWPLNFSVLFLLSVGLLSLLSANQSLFYKQFLFLVIGLIFIFTIIRFDWRPFINHKGIILAIYFSVVLLLVATYFFAPVIRGVRGWLPLGPFQVQTSEFAKIALIIILAGFFSRKHIGIARISNLLASFIYFAIPGFLIILQPDLGSALILFFIWFGFLLVSGIYWRHLAVFSLIFLIAGAVMWTSFLKDYQKERILGLFSPERDPLGVNYSVIQAKIAIGSAGFFGKGFGQGTQTQLGFLPEAQTDFIFSAIIEEFGLIAGFLAIAAFTVLIFRIIKIGFGSDNNFSRFFCLGTSILFCAQFVLNVGSNLGLTPVIGVTFPFLSYGGSSLLTNLILVGIIQSIALKR
ncbi:MAG: FtsW/RodA/SpoVE family cell cycle protein [Patescibacteria group bacterium]